MLKVICRLIPFGRSSEGWLVIEKRLQLVMNYRHAKSDKFVVA